MRGAEMPFSVELRSATVVKTVGSQFSIRSGPVPIQSGPPISAIWALWRKRLSSVGLGFKLMNASAALKTYDTALLCDRS